MLSPAVKPADLQPSMEELPFPGSVSDEYLLPGICTREYSRRRFQLRFSTGVSSPVMTGKKIWGEGCQFIKVVLFNDSGNEIVSGPEALAGEVEIVVLGENFAGAAGADNWTPQAFDENIITGWIKDDNKSPLAGATILKLKGGVGVLSDIRFIHDSRWVSKTKCRLGARAVDKNNRLRVREAITEPFELKDCRLEWNGKHCSPSLLDEVWRLKQIARNGPRDIRLREANIKTVKDFLILLFLNPPKLQKIYGGAGKNWEDTARHALTCADKMVCYASNSSGQDHVVVNASGEVLGLRFECKFTHFDKLSDAEKDFAHRTVISAFEHPENVVLLPIDDEKDLVHGSPNDLPSVSYNQSCEPRAADPSATNDFGVMDMIMLDDHSMQPIHDHLFPPDHGLMMHTMNDEFFASESYSQNHDHWFHGESSYNNDHQDLGFNNEEEPRLDIFGAGSSVFFAADRVQRRGKELWRVWSNVWFFIKKMGHDQSGHVHANKRLRIMC